MRNISLFGLSEPTAKIAVIAGLILIGSVVGADATPCTSYPWVFTTNTTAQASQVNDDFTCAARTGSPTIDSATFTGTTTFPGSTVIDLSGKLGVGTSPGVALDVSGSSTIARIKNITATGYASFRLWNDQNNASRALEIDYSGSTYAGPLQLGGPTGEAAAITATGAYPLIFGTNNTFRGMFGSDGSFLVGTTANGGWSGTAKGEFRGTSSSGPALSVYSNDTGTNDGLTVRRDGTLGSIVRFYYNTTSVGTITTNGSTTNYGTASDERLKNWSISQRNYEAAIRSLWVGNFIWKANGQTDFGVRAQQVYPIFPFAIHKPDTAAGQWQADYGKLAPLALWGVKDLYKSADSQNARISALEHEISALRQVNDVDQAEIRQLKAQISLANDNQAQINRLLTQVTELRQRVGIRAASN